MNILFVHEVDWLQKVVFDIHSLAEALSLLGHRVFAIDYENTWQRRSPLDLGTLKTKEFNGISRALSGSSVNLRRPGFIKLPGLSRLSAGLTHYLEIQKTIRAQKIDVIMLYSVPTNGLQTIHLARKFGIPVVFRSIDILYRLVRHAALRAPTRLLERKVYTGVDKILAITPNHARYVASLGADESKVRLLPMPVDTSIFHPSVDSTELRRQWQIGEKDPVIVFIGTLFDFSGLDGFIHQFPQVLATSPQARLLIVGDGPQRPLLERIIDSLRLKDKVTITGFQPYATMPQYINLATVCISTFPNAIATRDIFPGKVIQYLACGKATVATPLLGIKTLVKDESGGIVYAENAADMAREVARLLEAPERRQHLGQAGLDYARGVHDQAKIARKLEDELLEIVK